MTDAQKTVVVVEDQKPIARALKLKLEDAGYVVRTAADGAKGIDTIQAEGGDLVILDLMMPEMDGFAVLEQLNEEDIPVFVFSNLRQESDRKRAKKLGAEDFLVKSDVQVSEVIDRVNEFIGS